MHLKIKIKFTVLLFGALGLAVASSAQVPSERPVSELYRDAGVDKHGRKPLSQQSASSGRGTKTLPSEQRIITPPKSTLSRATNYTPRKVSVQEGKKGLPSSNSSIQKYTKRRQIQKPSVPTPEEGRVSAKG